MRSTIVGWASVASCLLGLGCVDLEELERERERLSAPPPRVFEIVRFKPEELPATKRVSGALDDDHLIVPIPEDWYVPPRSTKWLLRLQFAREEAYPAIIVHGGENTDTVGKKEEPIKQLGKSNIEAYAKQIEEKLAKELKKRTGKDLEPPLVSGLNVDRFYGVMYVQPVTAGRKSLDQLVIITIQRGRKYTVELRALRGTLSLFRPQAYAVASRMKIF